MRLRISQRAPLFEMAQPMLPAFAWKNEVRGKLSAVATSPNEMIATVRPIEIGFMRQNLSMTGDDFARWGLPTLARVSCWGL